jgi:hypothetical protein
LLHGGELGGASGGVHDVNEGRQEPKRGFRAQSNAHRFASEENSSGVDAAHGVDGV